MFFDPECIPCIVKQSYNSAKFIANSDTRLQLRIIKEICSELHQIDESFTAPQFSKTIQNIIEKYTGADDPYRNLKEANLQMAEKFMMVLKVLIESSPDKLETALRIAITGNTIDFAANPDFDIESEINMMFSNRINLGKYNQFLKDLSDSKTILYIADNFEEVTFDKYLIEQLLPKRIFFAVRSRAIFNDVTLSDARRLNVDKLCGIIESGSRIAGTDLAECSPEFIELFNHADMVIAKGQGNFETLLNEKRPIYFLFKVKCQVISRRCGHPVGTGILFYNQT